MATEKILIEIQTQMKESAEELKKVKDELKGIKEGQEDIQKNSKKTAKGIGGIAKAFKGVGVAIKAMGIGLVLKAFDLFSDILMENQVAVNIFSTAFEFASIVVSDFINFIFDNSDAIIGYFKAIFEDPLKPIKDLGDAIYKYLKEPIDKFVGGLGLLGAAVSELMKGNLTNAAELAGSAFDEMGQAAGDAFDTVKEDAIEVTKEVVNYTKEVGKAATAQVKLNKAAELAEIRNQGLIESYDRQAEKLRQIRDDDTKTMEERMKANDDLGVLLEEQETAMLANAQIRLEQANKKLALDKNNHEAQKEQMTALNELAAIEAQIEGFRSEQISNRISLQREAADIEQELLDEKIDAQSDYWAAITEKMEAAVEAEEKKREEADEAAALSKENYFATVDTGFAAMSQLFAENAAMQKGLAVAETVWNTSKAIMGMLSVQPATPANFALAAATAAMGVAQIANILKTNPDEGGGGGSISVPSAPAINTSVNALETSPNAQIAGLGNAEPQRAFVVSTDITTQQGLDRRILSNATFG